jgi:hypothetical protein
MATLQGGFSCLMQSELDDQVRLLSDPDVQFAYVNRPADRIDLDVNLAAAEPSPSSRSACSIDRPRRFPSAAP